MIVYMVLMLYWGVAGVLLKQNFGSRLHYNHKIYFLIAGVSLFLIMALRNISVGTDLLGYSMEYENSGYYLDNKLRSSELGYSYFNHGLNSLGLSFQSYIAIIALFVVIAISKLYYEYSKNILLSYFLFVTLGLFGMTMTGLRQTLAISLTVFAFYYLMQNKKVLFFILVGIAYFFHNSAIIFLSVFFIRNMKITKEQGFIIYGITCILFFARDWISLLVMKISPEKYILETDISINPLVIIVSMAIPLACLFFWPKKENNHEEEYHRIMSIFLLNSCIIIISYFLALEIALFGRISYYFIIYNTILIPNIIHGIKSRDIKMVAIIACIILPLIQFLISTPGGSLGIDNYKFFWE